MNQILCMITSKNIFAIYNIEFFYHGRNDVLASMPKSSAGFCR